MPLIDTHCHLTHKYYQENGVENFIKRAEAAGVQAILCSGITPISNRKTLELSKKYKIVKASLGLYPIDLLGIKMGDDDIGFGPPAQTINIDEELKFIEQNKGQVIAVGEIGMDFHWAEKEKTLSIQKENFRKIIRFAKKINKPIVIHSRKAELECIDVLEEELPNKEIPIIHHCFGGKKKLMKRAAELGHNFSIPAVVKRLQHFQMLIDIVPITQLLTETDGPYLSPDPEGKSESAHVIESIKKIAEIKKITLKKAEKQVWENYVRIFEEK